MLRPFRQKGSPFDPEIARLLAELKNQEPNSEKYGTTLDRLTKVHKMKADECRDRVRLDTLVTSGASLIGILLILNHEQLHPITSKAFGIMPRPK